MGTTGKTFFLKAGLALCITAGLAAVHTPVLAQSGAIDMANSPSAFQGLFPGSRPMAPAASPELIEARLHILAKRWNEAASLIEAQLEKRPRDPQWRFMQAVLFAEIGKRAEAITVFELLTEDFPELAEPYNNLAALYIEAGELHRARLLLERAIQNRPDYALAHENLGDVYVRLAKQSYSHASKSRQPAPSVGLKIDYLDQMPAIRATRVLTNR
jgi:tetratricopeptide (TPR) repeat protein